MLVYLLGATAGKVVGLAEMLAQHAAAESGFVPRDVVTLGPGFGAATFERIYLLVSQPILTLALSPGRGDSLRQPARLPQFRNQRVILGAVNRQVHLLAAAAGQRYRGNKFLRSQARPRL